MKLIEGLYTPVKFVRLSISEGFAPYAAKYPVYNPILHKVCWFYYPEKVIEQNKFMGYAHYYRMSTT